MLPARSHTLPLPARSMQSRLVFSLGPAVLAADLAAAAAKPPLLLLPAPRMRVVGGGSPATKNSGTPLMALPLAVLSVRLASSGVCVCRRLNICSIESIVKSASSDTIAVPVMETQPFLLSAEFSVGSLVQMTAVAAAGGGKRAGRGGCGRVRRGAGLGMTYGAACGAAALGHVPWHVAAAHR